MKYKIIIISCLHILFSSCDNDGRGYEYMPNMYRSPSLETYGKNTVFSDSLNARKPVVGTIARGYLKTFNYSDCLLYTSPSPRDRTRSRMPSSA